MQTTETMIPIKGIKNFEVLPKITQSPEISPANQEVRTHILFGMERVLFIIEMTTQEINRNKTLCPPNPQTNCVLNKRETLINEGELMPD